MNTIDLHELLSYVDFDYRVIDDTDEIDREMLEENPGMKQVLLIDEQGVYLGGIGEERFLLDGNLAESLIDRLEIYWDDYAFNPIMEDLCEKLGRDVDPDNTMTYEDAWNLTKEAYGPEAENITILPYICGAQGFSVAVPELEEDD